MIRLRTIGAVVMTFGLLACEDSDDTTGLANASDFEVRIENIAMPYDFLGSGSFSIPAGSEAAGPLFPGGTYEFEFSATPGSKLSFVTMFVQSNDFFYAPDGAGIELFDAQEDQVVGDITGRLLLWDSGTEADQEPGLGADQAPRQGGPDTGAADGENAVRLAADAFGNLPGVEDVIRVTLESTGPSTFRARIENVSSDMTLATSDGMTHAVPLSPGAWVVHTADDPLFTVGQPDRGEGLEAIAEDGSAGGLADELDGRSGVASPLSPGVFAVHTSPSVLFRVGSVDSGMGLEALAEDGDPGSLSSSLSAASGVQSAGAFNTPEGAAGPAPALPGGAYTFSFSAAEGDRLSFATMYVQSNDLFFAPAEAGLDLFPGGNPLNGDISGMVLLWDAGTEVNEAPGFGLYQAPRQPGANTGDAEGGVVRQVDDGYSYPTVSEALRVTIRPN